MRLTADDLERFAASPPSRAECEACVPRWLAQAGKPSRPRSTKASLEKLGALWLPGDDEPTLAEHHPAGTRYWSADAPIAPAFHPANRCEVWSCRHCQRAFLRYTEYGGYYEERRIRALDPALLDFTGLPGHRPG
jgi:hypothetical protein